MIAATENDYVTMANRQKEGKKSLSSIHMGDKVKC